jgi:DNA helicase-2/ATP-dependent DNA helicase PcrA
LRLFTERVVLLLAAATVGDKFAVMSHLRRNSPLLKGPVLANSDKAGDLLRAIRETVDAITSLDTSNPDTQFLDVLKCVATHGLFEIPTALRPFAEIKESETQSSHEGLMDVDLEIDEETETSSTSLQAWRAFLETPTTK